jgi:hypothetical protein
MGCKDGFVTDKVSRTPRRCVLLDKYRQHAGGGNAVAAATSLVLH